MSPSVTQSITGAAADFHPDWTATRTDEDIHINDIRVNGIRWYRSGG
jgi:hypothetical protein